MPPGATRFSVSSSRFPSEEGTIELVDGEITRFDIAIPAAEVTMVRGRVLGPDDEGLGNSEVRTTGGTTVTDAEGRFSLDRLDPARAPFPLRAAPSVHMTASLGWSEVVEARPMPPKS